MTLGSLFDGSGGFPLAGSINGITPLWASEIEPYPLRVTAKRFPSMKQLGDITKITGDKIEPVDIVTFGSPCQDLSIAGKRAGIRDGERSSLFFHAIRVIKEMREATHGKYPKYAVWENVPGAFSSNQKRDFAAVLEAFASVCQDGVSIPIPKKWEHAGCLVGDGWSIAWRLYDAQYWGVPQRRKRIYLIASFGDERAGEVLFKSESVSGDTEQSRTQGEDTSRDTSESTGETSGRLICLEGNGARPSHKGDGYKETDTMYTLNTIEQHAVCVDMGGGKPSCRVTDDMSPVLTTTSHGHAVCVGNHDQQDILCFEPGVMSRCGGHIYSDDKSGTLRANAGDNNQAVLYKAVDGYNGSIDEKQSTLGINCGISTGRNGVLCEKQPTYIVRRLTPLECCRLQGFPDWWETDVEGSDTARYKMWGNGIALPCAVDVLRRINENKN